VAHELLPTFLDSLKVVRIGLTRPSFARFVALAIGWVRSTGRHAVTEAMLAAGIAGRRHHAAFHRFFSRGTWNPDLLALWVFRFLSSLLVPGAPIRIVIDDTLAPKKGPRVFGIGSHIDPVRSTVLRKVFCFGHCWVVLSVVLPVPGTTSTFALPLLFRLYTNVKACEKKGLPYRKKTELGAELLKCFAEWTSERIELAVDAGYANEKVVKGMPHHVVMIGPMRPDAVLTERPSTPSKHRNGRPRVRGDVLPKPQALANDESQPWQTCEAHLYGKTKQILYKTLCAQWYQACGTRLLRIVVVRIDTGRIPLRVFFCTDPSVEIRYLLEGYSSRWSIEVCFRNLKQLFGFADSSARTRAAVLRTAPFVGLVYSLLVVWYFKHAHTKPVAAGIERPWYRQKRGVAFADILRTAQRVVGSCEVLDLLAPHKDLRQVRRRRRPPSRSQHRRRSRLAR
jgi:hypothetical protein